MGGRLPKGWKRVALRDCVASIASGVSVNGESQPALESEKGVLKVSAVSAGRFMPHENKKIVSNDIKRARLNPRIGCLLMSRANTPELVGAVAYVEGNYPNLFLSDKLWQIRVSDDDNASAKWVAAILSSDVYRKKLMELATGSSRSMRNISQDAFLDLEIPLPQKNEQRQVVAVLDTADNLGSNAASLLAALQARYKANLFEAFKPIQSKRTAGWRVARFGEIFSEREERSADLPLLAITGELGVVPRDELDRRDTSAEDKSSYKVIRKGDIGYNTMRMWQGVCGLSRYDGIVSPAYVVVTPDESRILGGFAAHLFRHPRVIHTFRRYSQGLVDDTLMLKYPQFSEVGLPIPSIDEQRRIADMLDSQLLVIEQQHKLVLLRKQQKRGLLQKLLTGEWRLTHDLPETEVVDVGA